MPRLYPHQDLPRLISKQIYAGRLPQIKETASRHPGKLRSYWDLPLGLGEDNHEKNIGHGRRVLWMDSWRYPFCWWMWFLNCFLRFVKVPKTAADKPEYWRYCSVPGKSQGWEDRRSDPCRIYRIHGASAWQMNA